jgi:putative aldouronate transport system substrate-binding protein
MRTIPKRVFGGLTAGTLALTLVACGGADEATEGESEGVDASELEGKDVGAMDDYEVGTTFVATEPVELPMLYRDHPAYPLQDDWLILETIEERNNVTFDITTAPLSDWDQRRALLIGAGDAPHLIPVSYPGQEAQYVASGALLPVSDYLDLMPNFTEKVEAWDLGEEIDQLRQEDGKFYLLPGLLQSPRPDYTIAMRMDVLDELGLEQPTTWDEFAETLAAIKEAKGGNYVFSDRWKGDALLQLAAPTFGTVGGWGLDASEWDADAEKFVFPGATDEYRDMVEYFAGLVEDGLMDPESFTQEDDTAFQKLANEQSFAVTSNAQELLTGRTALDTTLGAGSYELAKIRQPAGPAGDIFSNSRLQSGLMISADALEDENFVAMMQFVDWLYYSDEGLEFSKWGVEGETFTKEGETRQLAADVDWLGLNPGAPTNLRTDYGFMNGVFMHEHGSSDELVRSLLPEEEIAWQESMADKERIEVAPPAPLDELEREQASLSETSLLDYVRQNTLAFITGQRDLSEWDDYVTELEGQNLTAYMDIVNGAQQRYAETNG